MGFAARRGWRATGGESKRCSSSLNLLAFLLSFSLSLPVCESMASKSVARTDLLWNCVVSSTDSNTSSKHRFQSWNTCLLDKHPITVKNLGSDSHMDGAMLYYAVSLRTRPEGSDTRLRRVRDFSLRRDFWFQVAISGDFWFQPWFLISSKISDFRPWFLISFRDFWFHTVISDFRRWFLISNRDFWFQTVISGFKSSFQIRTGDLWSQMWMAFHYITSRGLVFTTGFLISTSWFPLNVYV